MRACRAERGGDICAYLLRACCLVGSLRSACHRTPECPQLVATPPTLWLLRMCSLRLRAWRRQWERLLDLVLYRRGNATTASVARPHTVETAALTTACMPCRRLPTLRRRLLPRTHGIATHAREIWRRSCLAQRTEAPVAPRTASSPSRAPIKRFLVAAPHPCRARLRRR